MKKTLLALACAAMATASLHAESFEIVRTTWKNPTYTFAMAQPLANAIDGFNFSGKFVCNVAADEVRLNASAGSLASQNCYIYLTNNNNAYTIESLDITFGDNNAADNLMLNFQTGENAFGTSDFNAITTLEMPFISGETINVPIDAPSFSLWNANKTTYIPIKKIVVNYSAGAPKEDPSWTLVNPGNEMTPGSSFTPAVENNTENLDITYTLKFSTMPIKANADGSFDVPYSNGTYTLTASSAVTDSYNAKEQSVQFTVAAQEAKWVIVEPTGLVKGDKYTPTFSVTPDTDTEVTFTLSWEKVTETESEDGEGNVTTTTSTSWIEVDRNADGSYNLENAGRYKLVAESEASAKYNKRTQTVYFTVENATGVETIDADAEVTYYTLQGVAVKDATPGLYIMKQGKTVRKVIIK